MRLLLLLLLLLFFFFNSSCKSSLRISPFRESYVIEMPRSALARLETEVAHGVSDNAFRNKSFVIMYFYPAIASIFLLFSSKPAHVISFFFPLSSFSLNFF